jgi:hypothetical protein
MDRGGPRSNRSSAKGPSNGSFLGIGRSRPPIQQRGTLRSAGNTANAAKPLNKKKAPARKRARPCYGQRKSKPRVRSPSERLLTPTKSWEGQLRRDQSCSQVLSPRLREPSRYLETTSSTSPSAPSTTFMLFCSKS